MNDLTAVTSYSASYRIGPDDDKKSEKNKATSERPIVPSSEDGYTTETPMMVRNRSSRVGTTGKFGFSLYDGDAQGYLGGQLNFFLGATGVGGSSNFGYMGVIALSLGPIGYIGKNSQVVDFGDLSWHNLFAGRSAALDLEVGVKGGYERTRSSEGEEWNNGFFAAPNVGVTLLTTSSITPSFNLSFPNLNKVNLTFGLNF